MHSDVIKYTHGGFNTSTKTDSSWGTRLLVCPRCNLTTLSYQWGSAVVTLRGRRHVKASEILQWGAVVSHHHRVTSYSGCCLSVCRPYEVCLCLSSFRDVSHTPAPPRPGGSQAASVKHYRLLAFISAVTLMSGCQVRGTPSRGIHRRPSIINEGEFMSNRRKFP